MVHKFEMNHVQSELENEQAEIRPLTPLQTLLAFGIPALMMVISFHWAMPTLQNMSLTIFESIVVAHTVPMALLLTAAIVFVHKADGYPLTKETLRQRLRYPRLTGRAILWGIIIFVVSMIGYGFFNAIGAMLVGQGVLPIPGNIPALFDPQVTLTTSILDGLIGGQIKGNWGIIILYAVMLFFNVVGEELWWRGYILPRQEATYGRFAWVWHGLLWTAFHLFKWWDLIGLLPVCLAIAYVSQRTKNNWPAMIAHFLFNGLGLLAVIAAVAGA